MAFDLNENDWDLGCTSPGWFPHRNHNLLSVAGKEGVVYLIDADDLGDKDHHTELFTTPRMTNLRGKDFGGALPAWQDDQGEIWVYVPVWGPVSKQAPKFPKNNGPNPNGSIMAFKVIVENSSKTPSLESVWVSDDFNVPEPIVLANGVAFGLSNGQNVKQSR